MHNNNSPLTNPYLLLALTTLFWGGNAVAGKIAAGHVSPFLLTTLRWIIATIVLLPFAWPHLKRDWPVIRRHLPFLCLCGTIGFMLFNNLLYLSLNYTSAINVAIEQASMPLIVFILNYLLFRTRTTIFQMVGFAIALCGVIITVSRGNVMALLSGDANLGDMLMLLAVFFYGVYSVIISNKPRIHLVSFLTVLSIAAMLTSIPFTVYEAQAGRLIMPDATGWGAILYAGIFPSLVSQFFWVMGLEQIGSNRGGLFINLVPVFGTILAIIILGETFQPYHAIGFVLVLGGIALAQKKVGAKAAI